MKECSRRLRADAPQRWTDSVPNKVGPDEASSVKLTSDEGTS
jgi:hypothetical protein